MGVLVRLFSSQAKEDKGPKNEKCSYTSSHSSSDDGPVAFLRWCRLIRLGGSSRRDVARGRSGARNTGHSGEVDSKIIVAESF